MRAKKRKKRQQRRKTNKVLNIKAIIIGMEYPGGMKGEGRLTKVDKEIRSVYGILRRKFEFPAEEILALCDKGHRYRNASYDNITNYVSEMVVNSQSGDRLFLYVAGHGVLVDEIARPASVLSAEGELISEDFWRDIRLKVPSGVTLYAFMNCCHSGSFFNNACEDFIDTGDVIAFAACMWNEKIVDGLYFDKGLRPAL
ncbi:metacaspase-7-like [Lotus japonicus]|uniref:metacaspase-7-like n=1 Tax=Lotus japonicus TaxID=34305 RepID=UPI0025833B9E|nr:metacaspase-7-like [Lotus japonicus]